LGKTEDLRWFWVVNLVTRFGLTRNKWGSCAQFTPKSRFESFKTDKTGNLNNKHMGFTESDKNFVLTSNNDIFHCKSGFITFKLDLLGTSSTMAIVKPTPHTNFSNKKSFPVRFTT
jgi:hypothetical protein